MINTIYLDMDGTLIKQSILAKLGLRKIEAYKNMKNFVKELSKHYTLYIFTATRFKNFPEKVLQEFNIRKYFKGILLRKDMINGKKRVPLNAILIDDDVSYCVNNYILIDHRKPHEFKRVLDKLKELREC